MRKNSAELSELNDTLSKNFGVYHMSQHSLEKDCSEDWTKKPLLVICLIKSVVLVYRFLIIYASNKKF